MTRKKYNVYPALSEDMNAPYIWASDLSIHQRPLAKITNTNTGDSIVCQVLNIDHNFRNKYNGSPNTKNLSETDPVVVMSEWYRRLLGISKDDNPELEIGPKCQWFPCQAQIKASYSHPDYNIRLAVTLAIVSVFLGVVGFFLGIISLYKCI
jgi:hypothetical protein